MDTPEICRNKKQSGWAECVHFSFSLFFYESVYCKNASFSENLDIQRIE